MILLWGLPTERPLAAVHDALRLLERRVAVVDQRAVLRTAIEFTVDANIGGRVRVYSASGGNSEPDLDFPLESVTAAYLRPYDVRRAPPVREAGWGSPLYTHAVEVEDALWSWSELTPALVINRPSAAATNNSKPYQAAQICSVGFEVPDTIITTTPESVREFWERHGCIIYKSISGVRSIVSRLTTSDLSRLGDVASCPTQFQEYVEGTDHRVHVVGDEVFACEIISEADDYRYAGRQGESVTIRSCVLPKECSDRCRELAACMGLSVAGVDLRRTKDGAWYCFEVNPSPAFTYYERETKQPIAAAVARLLAAATNR